MKNKLFNIPIHSIILLVGPANSGKTHLCKNVLLPELSKNSRPDRATNIQYISAEDISRSIGQLHFEDFHKYSNEMVYTSEMAMDMICNRVKNVTSYPLNAEYVVVDTVGLSDSFRQRLIGIAKESQYNIGAVVMNFNDKKEYFKYVPEDEKDFFIPVIKNGLQVMKNDGKPLIAKKDFKFVHNIESIEFNGIGFESSNFQDFQERILNPNIKHVVIGDAHGCLDELKELIIENGFEIDENGIIKSSMRRIILVGDIVDKGPKIKEIIKFVFDNCKAGTMSMVVGNHENFVVKFLQGDIEIEEDRMKKGVLIKAVITEEFLRTYMNSVFILEDDEETKNMLFELVEKSKEFYIHRDFIVTHAPCKKKYLGKMDNHSLRAQRMITYPKRKDASSDEEYVKDVEDFFHFLKPNREGTPFHLFGHVQCESMTIGNRVNLDTGCVSGGKLTSATVLPDRTIEMKSVESKQPKVKELFRFFDKK